MPAVAVTAVWLLIGGVGCGGDRTAVPASSRSERGRTASGSAPSTASSGPASTTSSSTTSTSVIPTTTVPAATTAVTAAVPPSTAPVTPPALPGAPAGGSPFDGIGAWVDVYDWSPTVTGGRPSVRPSAVAEMARAKVDTLYLQSSRSRANADVVDPEVFRSFVAAAHERGIKVVGWYLPEHADPAKDLRRLSAIAAEGVDGIGVDIEGTAVGDVGVRSSRLVALSRDLRAAVGALPLGAIVYSPLGLDLKTATWPGCPWRDIAPFYDAWLPMGYWTYRRTETPEWDDGERYTDYNFARLRELVGDPAARIHMIGGIAGRFLPGQVDAFVRSVQRNGGAGGSLYGWAETTSADRTALGPLAPTSR